MIAATCRPMNVIVRDAVRFFSSIVPVMWFLFRQLVKWRVISSIVYFSGMSEYWNK